MKIYKISNKILDVFPQIVTYNKKLCNYPSYFEIPNFGKIEVNNESLDTIYELKGKMITDLISPAMYSASSLIISDKFKRLISSLKGFEYQFIPIKITKKNESIGNYFLFHFVKSSLFFDQIVDWDKSIFKIQKRTADENIAESVNLINFEQYEKFDFEGNYMNGFEFNPDFKIKDIPEYGLFSFNYRFFPVGVFCTEKVKVMIEDERLTGIEFEEVINDDFRF